MPSSRAEIIIRTNLAQNDPGIRIFNNLPTLETLQQVEEGIFEADTSDFKPDPNTYIVDNEDPGCQVIENSKPLERKTIMQKNRYSYQGTRWDYMNYKGGYGELTESFLEKISGQGSHAKQHIIADAVKWVKIP